MQKEKPKSKSSNSIHVMDYNHEGLTEKETSKLADCIALKDTDTVTWLNIDNAPPISFLRELRLGFDLHPVIIDDITNVNQRPKIEILDNYIYLNFKMLTLGPHKKIQNEQVSMVVAHKFLITFQQGKKGDTFEPVRVLIRKSDTRIRAAGTDYLAYELIDSVVNTYFGIMEFYSDKIETLEKETAFAPKPETLRSIYSLKRELLNIRKYMWPMREIVSIFERGDSPLVKKATRIYLRDVYEHLIQIIDMLETYRDILSGLLDVYLSGMSNRTNSVMKILTIITTIFMPLSFLASYYGMNFRYLPGLESHSGPFWVSLGMAAMLALMLAFFKRKSWF